MIPPVHIVKVSTLRAFWEKHPDAQEPLEAWIDAASHERWTTPQDIRNRYRSADFVANNRVVFNIGGNKYRLIVAVQYRGGGWLFVKFIGTHAEYDRVDAATVELLMEINLIKTEADYQAALAEVSALIDMGDAMREGSPEADRLEILGMLVETYERKHFPIEPPSAIAAIRFRMEQGALSVDDMLPVFGRPNRFYEVMNGKRPLSIAMIRKLHALHGIPLETLLREPDSVEA